MTIEQFLRESKFTPTKSVPTGTATTPDELYNKCISYVCPETQEITDAIIGWHKLLTWYAQQEGAVLLTRMYESQKGENKEWDNRRNSLTVLPNCSYAFCSNHFPRLILTMALNGFVPDPQDFWDMLVNDRKFYLSSLFGMTPVEKRITSYAEKAYPAKCYAPGWYLAHIISVMDMPYRGCTGIDIKNVFKLGEEKEWQHSNTHNCIIRNISDALNNKEKSLAVAHFLRLVDPINYFLVPNQYNVLYKKVNDSDKSPLGENELVIKYMLAKTDRRFGETFVDFIDKALVDVDVNQVRVEYPTVESARISAEFAMNINPHATLELYTDDEKIEAVAHYLYHNDGLRAVEEKCLGVTGKRGWEASNILSEKGVDTSGKMKNLLNKKNIDDAIADATDIEFKNTLNEIKARGLHLKP